MRVFRSTYRDRAGKKCKTSKWYVEFKDHLQLTRRFPALTDKRQSEALGRQVEKLAGCKMSGDPLSVDLMQWLESTPQKMRDRFVKIGLLDSTRVSSAKILKAHVQDYRESLKARDRTEQYVKETVRDINRVFDACGFVSWGDINANRIEKYLADLRDGGKGISARSSNAKLKAVKMFANWMVKNRRACESPVAHLGCLNTEEDRRRERRAIEVDEVRRLLGVTKAAPERFGMTGPQRSLLYRFACECGLRANELRNLRVNDFDFDENVVVLGARHAKNRKPVKLPLRPDTSVELKSLFASKLPDCKAFNMPSKDRTAMMLRADLADAGIEYETDDGVFDFHALRGECGTLLAATGCHPKTIQAILRHSDINLSLGVYTHSLRDAESEAVKRMPDLSLPSSESQKKTGTDDSVLPSCLARLCAQHSPTMTSGGTRSRVLMNLRSEDNPPSGAKNGDSGRLTDGLKKTGEQGFEPRLTDPESQSNPSQWGENAVFGSLSTFFCPPLSTQCPHSST